MKNNNIEYNNSEYYSRICEVRYIWMPPILSELTPIVYFIKLTHLGSEASIL